MEKASAGADWTCSEVCHPSDSLTALSNDLHCTGQSELWNSANPEMSVVTCRVARHIQERSTAELRESVREALGKSRKLSSFDSLAVKSVLPDAPCEVEEAGTGVRLVAVDVGRIELSHSGTVLELLIEKSTSELRWLIGCNLILRPLAR